MKIESPNWNYDGVCSIHGLMDGPSCFSCLCEQQEDVEVSFSNEDVMFIEDQNFFRGPGEEVHTLKNLLPVKYAGWLFERAIVIGGF
jgi:hypothetical protein